ncbi:hypothetical protein IFM89_004986 [Coptis chinensis]|uniref:Uncharacterized protein n=1 Tax=Coptis chinensis TaxID=261450 RepID=A0A835HNT9_9MAGN|nr:hypothetical protein IFM89_004986 [Coptis chinensis]
MGSITVGGKFVLGFAVIWWSIATALMPIAAKLVLPFLLVVRAFMGIESRRGQPNESRESESSKSVGWNTIKSSSESPRTGNWNSLESQETPQMEPSDPRVKKAEETKAGGWSGNDRHTQGNFRLYLMVVSFGQATSDLVEYSTVIILFIFHSLLSFCKYVLYFSSPTLALLLKPMRQPRVIAEIIMYEHPLLMGLHLFDGNKHHRRNLSIGTGSRSSPIHSHTYVNQNFMIPTSSPGQSSPMTQLDNCAVSCATSLSLSTIDDNVSKPQAELDRGDKDTEESSKHGDNNTHVRVLIIF